MDIQRKHLPADERRAVTVEAVVKLAARQNPSEITTAAIATSMKLTQGALFRHFPNKDAIWQAVMEWVADHLLARVERAARGASSPLAALEAMFMAHIAFVAEHAGVPRMLFGELQRAEDTAAKRMVQTMIRRYGERLRALIEDGKAIGELDPHAGTALGEQGVVGPGDVVRGDRRAVGELRFRAQVEGDPHLVGGQLDGPDRADLLRRIQHDVVGLGNAARHDDVRRAGGTDLDHLTDDAVMSFLIYESAWALGDQGADRNRQHVPLRAKLNRVRRRHPGA